MWGHGGRKRHLTHELGWHASIGHLAATTALLVVLWMVMMRPGHAHSLDHVLLAMEAIGPIGLIHDVERLAGTRTATALVLTLATGRHSHGLRVLLHVMGLPAVGRGMVREWRVRVHGCVVMALVTGVMVMVLLVLLVLLVLEGWLMLMLRRLLRLLLLLLRLLMLLLLLLHVWPSSSRLVMRQVGRGRCAGVIGHRRGSWQSHATLHRGRDGVEELAVGLAGK